MSYQTWIVAVISYLSWRNWSLRVCYSNLSKNYDFCLLPGQVRAMNRKVLSTHSNGVKCSTGTQRWQWKPKMTKWVQWDSKNQWNEARYTFVTSKLLVDLTLKGGNFRRNQEFRIIFFPQNFSFMPFPTFDSDNTTLKLKMCWYCIENNAQPLQIRPVSLLLKITIRNYLLQPK